MAEGEEESSSCFPSSSSSSSTLNRLGLRGLEGAEGAKEPSRRWLVWGLPWGLSPLPWFCMPGCREGPAEGGAFESFCRRWFRSSRAVFGRGPLWRLSALRAGDWGPPGWEMEGPPRLSPMS